jgi:cytochrome c biogenesis protein CcdA
MTTLTKQAETSSHRAIPSIQIGCATLFVILELGVTFLAALLEQTWAALIVTAIMVLVAL